MAFVLIVDGDPVLSKVLQQEFQHQGHQVLLARTSEESLSLAERCLPDLVVLSDTLPRSIIQETCQRLRSTPGLERTRVLFFSLKLQLGEDLETLAHKPHSFVRGPSVFSDITQQANAILRRNCQQRPTPSTEYLIAGKLVLCARNLTVECGGRVSTLTPTEHELLRYLMLHVNEACSATRLLQHVWGYPPGTGSTDIVRAHVRNLRQKIEPCPSQPVLLRTMRHSGYMLCSNRADEMDMGRPVPITERPAASLVYSGALG
ncbi:MAG: response regulator transcription factor [Chloroflexi bacterium]|nr:response regulator transcription factor [Chloroflexota bacterium]